VYILLIDFLSVATRAYLAFIALTVLLACDLGRSKKHQNFERLNLLVRQYRNDVTLNELKAIFVVTEEGCPTCNKSLAQMVDKYLDDSTSLFWVSAMGSMVDISPFKLKPERVVWDYDDSLRSSGIITGSGVILVSNGRVDTIVQLGNARTVTGALAYVSDLLQMR